MRKKESLANYTLMHKDTPVTNLEIIERTGTILKIANIHNLSHAPIGTLNQSQNHTRALRTWFNDRTIPRSRQNLNQIDFYHDLNIISPTALSLRNYGLSLSDQYWFKPVETNISWSSINFFQNRFSNDVGDALFGETGTISSMNLNSPDITTDGWLQKRWMIQDGKQALIKAGSSPFEQEAYNEEIATNIMKELKIPHTPYWVEFIDNKAYSMCNNFINEDTDLVTAWSVLNSKKKPNHKSNYQHLIERCKELGMGNVRHQLEQMVIIDCIIANTDRHWGNFGFIRDANTLAWKGFAPIYDSGTSLWHDKESTPIHVDSRAFKRSHKDQLKLINDLSWFEPIREAKLAEIIIGTLSKHPTMSDERIEILTKATSRQMDCVIQRKLKLTPKSIPVTKVY